MMINYTISFYQQIRRTAKPGMASRLELRWPTFGQRLLQRFGSTKSVVNGFYGFASSVTESALPNRYPNCNFSVDFIWCTHQPVDGIVCCTVSVGYWYCFLVILENVSNLKPGEQWLMC